MGTMRPGASKYPHLRMRDVLALGAALALFACPDPARADDPFDMESSSWMSFDRYKEKPSTWIAPDARAQAQQTPVIVPPPVMPANMPILTAPTRPVVPAVMPGFNKDFDIQVNSTADDNQIPEFKQNDRPTSGPVLDLDSSN